jgi:hypothetical protein
MRAHSLKARLAAAALVLVLAFGAVGAAGCGSSSSSSSGTPTIHFAKTKFLLHAGLAFGAFHRYIYKPYKARGFSPPSRHKAAIVKAGLAAAFAYHETKIALQDARASKILSKLVAPVLALQTGLSSLATRLKGGNLDASGIESTNNTVNSLQSQSSSVGAAIKDRTPPAP